METEIHVLDVVALLADRPAEGLRRGQVGTVVELLPPDSFELEFSDLEGRAYAFATCRADELLVLHQEAEPAR